MLVRPTFVTNSSSSCMIVWGKRIDCPEDMKQYGGDVKCPHCGAMIAQGEECELDMYLDEAAERVVMEKRAKGCDIFYQIEYLGAFPEDEVEYGDDHYGWYSFQC